ncbi:hypothetical protein GCM10027217_29210 [Pseudomaricurvus hydrocarbonicus]
MRSLAGWAAEISETVSSDTAHSHRDPCRRSGRFKNDMDMMDTKGFKNLVTGFLLW